MTFLSHFLSFMTFYDYMTGGSTERCPGLQFNMKRSLTVVKHTHSRYFRQENNKRNSFWFKIEENITIFQIQVNIVDNVALKILQENNVGKQCGKTMWHDFVAPYLRTVKTFSPTRRMYTSFGNVHNTILTMFLYILIKFYTVPKKFFRRTFKYIVSVVYLHSFKFAYHLGFTCVERFGTICTI